MAESELEANEPVVDISINTGSEEEDAAAAQLLDTLDLEKLVRRTLQAVHVEQAIMLSLAICGDAEIQALNRQYRRQDKPTDVLSFPLLDEPLVKAPAEWLWQAQEEENAVVPEQTAKPLFVTPAELNTNLGDIIISWPTMLRQASAAGHPASAELLFLLCHGVLHLVGYDDQTEAGYSEMVRLQKDILAGLEREG